VRGLRAPGESPKRSVIHLELGRRWYVEDSKGKACGVIVEGSWILVAVKFVDNVEGDNVSFQVASDCSV